VRQELAVSSAALFLGLLTICSGVGVVLAIPIPFLNAQPTIINGHLKVLALTRLMASKAALGQESSACYSIGLATGASFSIVGWLDEPWGRLLLLPHTEIMAGKGLIKG